MLYLSGVCVIIQYCDLWCCKMPALDFCKYYTSTLNCPVRKLGFCHVSIKLITISRLTPSISEPAVLLTMFHPMFPGEHGVEHYSRKPRETTRTTQCRKLKWRRVKIAFQIYIESEDEEIARILDGNIFTAYTYLSHLLDF